MQCRISFQTQQQAHMPVRVFARMRSALTAPALVCGMFLASACAFAQDASQIQQGKAATSADGFANAAARLDGGRLQKLRGGNIDSQVNAANAGWLGGNNADHVVAGDNMIDGGAFAHAAGVNTVIQNSGSNVLIQNGTAINVQFGATQP